MTAVEWRVLDASVAVKCLLTEADSSLARAHVAAHPDWAAPDLIHLEIASVATKSIRMGLLTRDQGAAMVARSTRLVGDAVSGELLRERAFALAADHGFSVYDAAYIALAELRGTWVLTADVKLVSRATAAGLGGLVRDLKTT